MAASYTFEVVVEGQKKTNRVIVMEPGMTVTFNCIGHDKPLFTVSMLRNFNGITNIVLTDPCNPETGRPKTMRIVKMEDRQREQTKPDPAVPVRPPHHG